MPTYTSPGTFTITLDVESTVILEAIGPPGKGADADFVNHISGGGGGGGGYGRTSKVCPQGALIEISLGAGDSRASIGGFHTAVGTPGANASGSSGGSGGSGSGEDSEHCHSGGRGADAIGAGGGGGGGGGRAVIDGGDGGYGGIPWNPGGPSAGTGGHHTQQQATEGTWPGSGGGGASYDVDGDTGKGSMYPDGMVRVTITPT